MSRLDLPFWRVRQGSSTFGCRAETHDAALARAARPDSCVLVREGKK